MSKNLVIVLSEDEYDYIHKVASEKGISASKYARDLIFPEENSFENKWQLLLNKIEKYPKNMEFDIAMIIGYELWRTYDRSTKLSLARTLSRKIADGTISDVAVVGRSSSNVTIYCKK